MNNPKGLIIIMHNGFAKITIDEVLKVLPTTLHSIHREVLDVSYSELLDLSKLYDIGYEQYALEHRRQFSNEILTRLSTYPDYEIVYFGLAPIPLCIDLGHLFHNYREITVYQKHHVTKEWYLNLESTNENNKINVTGMPSSDQKGLSDALIRLNVSHSINPDDTYEILPNAAEIDISVDNVHEDAISFSSETLELGEAVKSVFDGLSDNRSGLEKIHLFASIPCGVAFLIGTKISPNIHSYIQTYQFSRTANPKYKKALLIKARIEPQRKVTDEEQKNASRLKNLSDNQLTKDIREYCKHNMSMSTGRSWYLGLIPSLNPSIMNEEFWKDLPAICETSLKNDSFDFETQIINDGFLWRMNKWYVDNNFFISVNNRLKKDTAILTAVRLFLFHEAVHYSKHKLTDLTSNNIGSFPKVLETADYQADVYAILNEYGYHTKMFGEILNPKEFFLATINTAVETMWSFDDNGIELEEIQIRRLNRYMIWYWQYARIETAGDDINDIIAILEQKPVIELNGLKTKEENNRFYFILEQRKNQPLELGVFHNNQLIRNGSATNLLIENLIKGVKEMKGDLILNVMRSFLSQ